MSLVPDNKIQYPKAGMIKSNLKSSLYNHLRSKFDEITPIPKNVNTEAK